MACAWSEQGGKEAVSHKGFPEGHASTTEDLMEHLTGPSAEDLIQHLLLGPSYLVGGWGAAIGSPPPRFWALTERF